MKTVTLPEGDFLAYCYLRLVDGQESRFTSGDIRAEYQTDLVKYTTRGSNTLTAWNQAPIPIEAPAGLPASPLGYEWGALRLPQALDVALQGFFEMGVSVP